MDDEFAREVLRLAEGQTIDDYDEGIRHEAQELGIILPLSSQQHPEHAENDDEKYHDDGKNFKTTSTSTACSRQRRKSISDESQASQSTGFTSNFSRLSREQQQHDELPLLGFGHNININTPRSYEEKRKSTASMSLSIKDYDSILSHSHFAHRRLSLTNLPPGSSTFSSPLSSSSPASSSRESSPRRQLVRGLSRLRLHHRKSESNRSDSRRSEKDSVRAQTNGKHPDCCPQQSRYPHLHLHLLHAHDHHHCNPAHTLPCGHKYCTSGLRRIIKDAMDDNDDKLGDGSGKNGPPLCCCCKTPVPGALVERVMSQEEQDMIMSKMVYTWDTCNAAAVAAAAVTAENTNSTAMTTPAAAAAPGARGRKRNNTLSSRHSFTTDTFNVFAVQESRENLESAMNYPEFRVLRQKLEEQRDLFLELERRARQVLSRDGRERVERTIREHEIAMTNLVEKHALNISQVEDKHVQDEMDLRISQDKESRNTSIALRHMEAFCRGELSSSPTPISTPGAGPVPHHRQITPQDHAELAKTRHKAAHLDKKHEGEISVLRGEQSRRMAQRMARQDNEVRQLERRQGKEIEAIQRQNRVAIEERERHALVMRGKLDVWWRLRLEIWRKRVESETGVGFEGVFPVPVEWPDHDDDNDDDDDDLDVYVEGGHEEEEEEDEAEEEQSRQHPHHHPHPHHHRSESSGREYGYEYAHDSNDNNNNIIKEKEKDQQIHPALSNTNEEEKEGSATATVAAAAADPPLPSAARESKGERETGRRGRRGGGGSGGSGGSGVGGSKCFSTTIAVRGGSVVGQG